jgi:outer membrane receptor protein involved in Fe transport
MRRIRTWTVLVWICLMFSVCGSWPVQAQQANTESGTVKQSEMASESGTGSVKKLEDIVVSGKSGMSGYEISPSKTVIDVDDFSAIGDKNNIQDLLKTQAAVDFRGTDQDPGVDSIFLRGFDATRFVTAIDSVTVQKTGGRKSSNIVDYSLLPTFMIKEIEILPGPHSAIFDSKSIGGVINMVTRRPERKESLKPDISLTTSYSSYATVNTTGTGSGSIENFTYDAAYRHYSTDGYLRHSETDIESVYGRVGYLLPADGFVTVSASSSDTDRQPPVNNPGEDDGDYDSSYPTTQGGMFDPYSEPTWNGESYQYRLDLEQPTPIGKFNLGMYTGKDKRIRAYYANQEATELSVMDTDWWQEGGKLQDEIEWSSNHITTIGFDLTRLYDEGLDDDKTERINKTGGYLQHRWGILDSLDLTLGLRYEKVKIWVSNERNGNLHNSSYDRYVEREWDEFMPKFFLSWRLDNMAAWLRDSSFSLGVSKIWRAPDYHGDYNPQGRPAGIFLEPEHGVGYDLIFNRRLVNDIQFSIDFSFYDIEDYIATNSTYAQYSGGSAGALRYSDYKINLEEVYRYGIDVEIGGHLMEQLSFYMTYSWQDFDNQGDEYAGETELDQRAEHRISAGLRYQLFETTELKLDYQYQSDETTEVSEEITEDVWDFRQVAIDAHHTVDFGVEQILWKNKWMIDEASFSAYVKNVFDETYFNTSGFPANDRTFGATLRLCF